MPAAQQANPGVEKGDHVYVRHQQRGAVTVRVTAIGKDGFRGTCDKGQRWGVPWSDYLGHKARMLHQYDVVDQGADGVILKNDQGVRRYMAGGLPVEAQDATAAAGGGKAAPVAEPKRDDPLLDGLKELRKALAGLRQAELVTAGRALFVKALPAGGGGGLKNRPGLTLKAETDKSGKQTHRWEKTDEGAPAGKEGAGGEDKPVLKHGDTVKFQHGQVQHEGKIVASGRDGVTVHDGEREHQVRHEALLTDSPSAAPEGGEAPAGPAETPAGEEATPAANAPGSADALFDPAEMALPTEASQPVKTGEELFEKSGEALDQLKQWLDQGKGVCSQLGYETMTKSPDDVDWANAPKGGMLFIAKVKGEKRAKEKVESDFGGDWSKLLDPVRCSIAVDSFDDIQKTIEALKKSGGMVLARAPKDRFAKPTPVGYRDVLMNIKLPNGIIGEVQLHIKPMLAAKGEGHKPYEVMRTIDAKPKAQWTPEDHASYKKAFDDSVAIYNRAWSSRKSGNQGMMQKALTRMFDYFEHENAKFRRHGTMGGVDEVLHEGRWKPYTGNCTDPALYGNKINDPLGTGEMVKALGNNVVLFRKPAAKPNAASD